MFGFMCRSFGHEGSQRLDCFLSIQEHMLLILQDMLRAGILSPLVSSVVSWRLVFNAAECPWQLQEHCSFQLLYIMLTKYLQNN